MKKLLISGLVGKLGVLVPKDSVAAREFFADLGRNTEIFGLGVAFLGLQITNLENRCLAMHGGQIKSVVSRGGSKKRNFVRHLQREVLTVAGHNC